MRYYVIVEFTNIDDFLKKHHIKSSRIGGDLDGPTIKSLINNEQKLSELCGIIGEENHEFIVHLEDIAKVHKVATKRVLDIDVAKEVLANFNENWTSLILMIP